MKSEIRILWEGRPDKIFYVLSGLPISIFGALWLVIPVWFSILLVKGEGGAETYRYFLIACLIPFFGIGIGALFFPVLRYFEYKSVRYILTDSEVIIFGGIDKLITQPWPIRAEIARYAAAQFQDANARNRKNL